MNSSQNQSLSQRIRASLKGITPYVTVPAILNLFVNILVLDIFPYLRLIQAHCVHIISSRPKMMPFEIPFQTAMLLKRYHRAFALQVTNHAGYRIFGRNRQAHMNMVYAKITLYDFNTLILA